MGNKDLKQQQEVQLLKSKKLIVKFKHVNTEIEQLKTKEIEPEVMEHLDPEANLQPAENVYVSHPQRWWLLVTVILLNLANYSHWVAFPSVTKMAAKYYDQAGETMDLIPTISYGLGVPCCLLATYVVENIGLKVGLHIGGLLTGLGGAFCCLSSFPYVADEIPDNTKFILALIGQALTGIACPFISCVPTKISQHWFSDNQRTMATILIGMSNPMGLVLGQAITPFIVRAPSDIPYMNIVWFIPAALGTILTLWKVTTDRPPTPPSPSAAMQTIQPKNYLHSIKQLATNKAFIIMFFFIGGAMGYVSTISTKIEQILCSSGYSDQLSGVAGALILFSGFLSSFVFGIIAYKTKQLVLICRIACIIGIIAMILIAYFFRVPDNPIPILISCCLLGAAALGVYPLGLELVVECTYPIDQATGTAFLFLSSAIQGVLLMQVENLVGQPLSPEKMKIQSCVALDDQGHQQPKDYGTYLNFITCYMIFFVLLFVLFFRTKMNRTNADWQHAHHRVEPMPSVITQTSLIADTQDDSSMESGSLGSQHRGP